MLIDDLSNEHEALKQTKVENEAKLECCQSFISIASDNKNKKKLNLSRICKNFNSLEKITLSLFNNYRIKNYTQVYCLQIK